MAAHSGWLERGGRVVRQFDARGPQYQSEVVGRTHWIGRPEWARGFAYSQEQIQAIVEKAIAGKRLGRMQRALLESMLEEIDLDSLEWRWGKMTREEQDSALDEIFGEDSRSTAQDAPVIAPARAQDPRAEKESPAETGLTRPAQPCKAERHFPAQDRLRGTSARIYEMAKEKSKRSRGRPSLGIAKRIMVSLDKASIERARKLGGNVSAGIRKALAKAQ